MFLLTAHPELYTCRRLSGALRALGFRVHLDAPDPWWDESPPSLVTSREPIHGIPLLARPGPFSLIPVLRRHRRLTAAGARAFQTRRALLDACDQWRTLGRLRAAGLPVPRSRIVRSPADLPGIARDIPGDRRVVKARTGSKGSHVLLALGAEGLEEAVTFLWGEAHSVIVQPWHFGPVYRHLVAGDRVLATARATAAPGDYRTNWHRGGTFDLVPSPEPEHRRIAVRACRLLGLPYAGVDLIGDQDPVILEVNASPGLEGLEGVTGRDLAGELAVELTSVALPDRPPPDDHGEHPGIENARTESPRENERNPEGPAQK
jgi:ribosomal protein S6--L-glutamate ligase